MSTYRFYRFKFRVSPSQITLTSSLMTNVCHFIQPQSTRLSGLEKRCSIITLAATEGRNSSWVNRCNSVNLVCRTGFGESHWGHVSHLTVDILNI